MPRNQKLDDKIGGNDVERKIDDVNAGIHPKSVGNNKGYRVKQINKYPEKDMV
jgi:hypothetical protein